MVRSIKNLIASVLLAISGYLAFTQLLPAYSVTSYYKEKIEQKNITVASKTEFLQRMDKLREENNAKYTELQRLAQVLPDKKGIPEILSSIEGIYTLSGVKLPEITIGEGKTTGQLGSMAFSMNSQSSYAQFINIIANLEKNLRIYDLTKIEIALEDEEQESSPDPKLSVKVEGQAYVLKAPPKETVSKEISDNNE